MAKEIQLAVSKYLKKKKESVVVDLYIRDYNKTNFYIALVYNAKIEKFKVLFIPNNELWNPKLLESWVGTVR